MFIFSDIVICYRQQSVPASLWAENPAVAESQVTAFAVFCSAAVAIMTIDCSGSEKQQNRICTR